MTPGIIEKMKADGIALRLSPIGKILLTGERGAVARWAAVARENREGIRAALAGEPIPSDLVELVAWACRWGDYLPSEISSRAGELIDAANHSKASGDIAQAMTLLSELRALVAPIRLAWPDRDELREERAAILEYDAGFSRAEADRLAMEENPA